VLDRFAIGQNRTSFRTVETSDTRGKWEGMSRRDFGQLAIFVIQVAIFW
jgi:hypothetical protein